LIDRRAEAWERASEIYENMGAARRAGKEPGTLDVERLQNIFDQLETLSDLLGDPPQPRSFEAWKKFLTSPRDMGLGFGLRPEPDENSLRMSLHNYRGGGSNARKLQPGEARLIGPDEKISDCVELREYPDGIRDDEISVARMFKGILTNDWRGGEAEFRAHLQMDVDKGGGWVHEKISSMLLDRARDLSVAVIAGARVVPMEGSELKVIKITGDTTASWIGEGKAFPESSMSFGSVHFRAKKLGLIADTSIEINEDVVEMEDELMRNLGIALASGLDLACIYGTGVGEQPLGVSLTSGVNEIDMGENGAAFADYDPFVDAMGNCLSANGPLKQAAVFSPRTWVQINKLVDGNENPRVQPKIMENLRMVASNRIPNDLEHGTAEDASEAFVGDWSQLWIGMRTQLQALRSESGTIDGVSAFQEGKIFFRVHMRADVHLVRPEFMTAIRGIVPAA
jgi:HK97 family phage major capsid protein